MQQQFSIIHLIAQASFFVQFLMAVLFLMFVITLFYTGKKWTQFKRLSFKNKRFEQSFWSGSDLQALFEHYNKKESESTEAIFVDGFREFLQFKNSQLEDPDAIVHNCRRAMESALNREVHYQEKGLALLATFGSSAPYIGLLGTVYGIMNSFIAISGAQQTSIASVAPGIAEALIATAIGLLAAIPSVLAYNFFIARSESLSVDYESFIEEFSNLLQRQILLAREKIKRQPKS